MCESRHQRRNAPHQYPDDHQRTSCITIDGQTERQADGRVKETESQALQDADLDIGETEIGPHRIDDDVQDRSIEHRNDAREREYEHHPPCIAAIGIIAVIGHGNNPSGRARSRK